MQGPLGKTCRLLLESDAPTEGFYTIFELSTDTSERTFEFSGVLSNGNDYENTVDVAEGDK